MFHCRRIVNKFIVTVAFVLDVRLSDASVVVLKNVALVGIGELSLDVFSSLEVCIHISTMAIVRFTLRA